MTEAENKKKAAEPALRAKVLEKLEDLKKKIETNEPMPHGDQDYDLLSGVFEQVDGCLTNWYY